MQNCLLKEDNKIIENLNTLFPGGVILGYVPNIQEVAGNVGK